MMANEYEIARGSGKCAATGRELAEGEFYYVVLFETPQGFERKDLAVETWDGPPEGAFCYWKARVPTREKKPAVIAVDNGLLVHLFCRLEEDSSEMRQKFRFVLALLLMRKRLLRHDKTTRDETGEYWHMRLLSEQSVHQVLNPQLSVEEIDRLSAQLSAILSGDSLAISAMEEQPAEPSALSAESSNVADEMSVVDEEAAVEATDANGPNAAQSEQGESAG